MLGHNLFKNAEVRLVTVDGTNYTLVAGTTDVNTGVVDTDGYAGVGWIVTVGAIAGSGAVTVKAQQDTASGMGTVGDVEGSSQGPTADTDDNKVILIDTYRPKQRYQRLAITRGDGGNSTILSVHAVLYNAVNLPVTQGSTVFGLETFSGPASGTA